MPAQIAIQRIPFTNFADNRLRLMKSRTGITPNILARIGFCISLEDGVDPILLESETDWGREINKPTLLGAYELHFTSLLTQWMIENNKDIKLINQYLIAHMNRGVEMLSNRIKSLHSFTELVSVE